MHQHQAVLIFSGYNLRAVVAFCRWATARKIEFHIIASGPDDPIFLTDYGQQVVITRDSPQLTMEKFSFWLLNLRNIYSNQRFLVLPSTEFLNRFLLQHKTAIEAENCIVPLVNLALYEKVSDKRSFVDACRSYKLPVPLEFAGIPDQYPFVAKPKIYVNQNVRKQIPHLIYDEQALDEFTASENTDEYFFQEIISGRSFYLLAYLNRNRSDVLYSQENLIQANKGGPIILAKRSDVHYKPEVLEYVDMLHDIGFSGLIMLELRLDTLSGCYVMIEANPRLWGPLQFSVDNNIDYFGALLTDHGFGFQRPESTQNTVEHYFWSGGLSPESCPLSYFNYSEQDFNKDFPSLKAIDIFNREDTVQLFNEESKSIRWDGNESIG